MPITLVPGLHKLVLDGRKHDPGQRPPFTPTSPLQWEMGKQTNLDGIKDTSPRAALIVVLYIIKVYKHK